MVCTFPTSVDRSLFVGNPLISPETSSSHRLLVMAVIGGVVLVTLIGLGVYGLIVGPPRGSSSATSSGGSSARLTPEQQQWVPQAELAKLAKIALRA